MNVQLNIPTPSSVRSTATGKQTFRLLTEDGRLFTRISRFEAVSKFPAAISAHIAAGNDRILKNDIPEFLQDDLVSALQAAGWFTKTQYFVDLDLMPMAAVPYSTIAYCSVPHLCWSAEPFPLTLEEKVWRWITSWFD